MSLDNVARHLTLLEEAHFEVLSLEEQLSIAKANLRTLKERDVPEAMESAGVSTAYTPSGFRVVLSDEVHVSMPAIKDRAPMVEWCLANKLPGLIKTTLTVHFSAKTFETVKPLIESFQNILGQAMSLRSFEFEVDTTIHGSTLKAFVTKALRKGQPLPEMFGYYAPREAVMTLPTVEPEPKLDLMKALTESLAKNGK